MQLTPDPGTPAKNSQVKSKRQKAKRSNEGHEKDGLQTAIMYESKPVSLRLVILEHPLQQKI
jgi:hypothetical protein